MTTPAATQITDYWERCKGLVLSQYSNAPRLLSLMEAQSNQSDDEEQALWEIQQGFSLATAVGVQLDAVGARFRESRLGRSDADYREAIQAKASLAVNGTPEQIMEFLRNTFPGLADIVYQPEYPAGFALLTDDTTSGTNMLQYLKPSGVHAAYGTKMTDYLGNPMTTYTGDAMYGVRA